MKRLACWLMLAAMCGSGLAVAQEPSTAPREAAQSSATVEATPAIWRVQGAHGTVYLFGSIHVMRPNVDWQTAKVKQAFAASNVLYVEVANLDDSSAALPVAMQLGMDTAHPLSSKISKDDVALLDKAAKSMGLPGEQVFERMQPWLASMTLSVMPMLKDGYAPKSGIDVTLLAEAKDAGKTVKGFETMAQQIHLLADLPQAEQVKMLHRDLTETDKAAAEMNEMVAAWEKGDVDTIAKLENSELEQKDPAVYQRLVVERNQRWTSTLNGVLKDPSTGTVFVAVGAAHLAGPDSVIQMLEKDGWKVERE